MGSKQGIESSQAVPLDSAVAHERMDLCNEFIDRAKGHRVTGLPSSSAVTVERTESGYEITDFDPVRRVYSEHTIGAEGSIVSSNGTLFPKDARSEAELIPQTPRDLDTILFEGLRPWLAKRGADGNADIDFARIRDGFKSCDERIYKEFEDQIYAAERAWKRKRRSKRESAEQEFREASWKIVRYVEAALDARGFVFMRNSHSDASPVGQTLNIFDGGSKSWLGRICRIAQSNDYGVFVDPASLFEARAVGMFQGSGQGRRGITLALADVLNLLHNGKRGISDILCHELRHWQSELKLSRGIVSLFAGNQKACGRIFGHYGNYMSFCELPAFAQSLTRSAGNLERGDFRESRANFRRLFSDLRHLFRCAWIMKRMAGKAQRMIRDFDGDVKGIGAEAGEGSVFAWAHPNNRVACVRVDINKKKKVFFYTGKEGLRLVEQYFQASTKEGKAAAKERLLSSMCDKLALMESAAASVRLRAFLVAIGARLAYPYKEHAFVRRLAAKAAFSLTKHIRKLDKQNTENVGLSDS